MDDGARPVTALEPNLRPNRAGEPTNVLIVGVGGQGVIMVSKVLALLTQRRGLQVKQSEVHGMAKRGGGVFSHVRFGTQVWSPTIPKGEADILLALEWAEGLRWLDYLRPETGTFIADTQRIVPPFACRDRRWGAELAYSKSTPEEIIGVVGQGFALDAVGIARDLGNEKAANTVLLGAMSTALDFALDEWLAAIEVFVPPRTVEINRRAFAAGREWINAAEAGEREHADPQTPLMRSGLAPEAVTVRLEIVDAWCKGCDICVKLCPERCLVLNAEQIAVLADPEKCTGCRLCEWLCPDFAIAVHVEKALAPPVA